MRSVIKFLLPWTVIFFKCIAELYQTSAFRSCTEASAELSARFADIKVYIRCAACLHFKIATGFIDSVYIADGISDSAATSAARVP